MSYIQSVVLTPEPADPLKSSLQTLDQPVGGAGTAAWVVVTAARGPAAAATMPTATAVILWRVLMMTRFRRWKSPR
ncbi:hypothetical protein GCM10009751_15280 [Myceligenerans crystallogenes]|uniref:Uncharacterized protein n=1 Tax=Myceligenerans crystallogenes TaxID=316335 RepID=A0ABN2N9D3_9MICO